MSKVKVNYKSDLPPIEVSFKVNREAVPVPTHDFIIRFYIEGGCGCYDCRYENGVYTNCEKINDNTLMCYINNHKFGCGRLCCDFVDMAANAKYSDGVLKTVTPHILDIELVEGVGDIANSLGASVDESLVTRGIRSIAKTGTSGLVDTYTITFSDSSTTTFTITNGAKGDQGDKGDKGDKGDQGNSGYTGAAGELEVVNNLTEGGATDALSAEMGKRLNGRLSIVENAATETVTYKPTVVEGKCITADPISSRGDIATAPAMELDLYSGLTAGSVITVTFEGEDTESAALAAGWYPTSNVDSMSSSNFTAVSEIVGYTKTVAGHTYTVTVPSEAPTLALSAFSGHVTTVVVSANLVGGKIFNIDEKVTELEGLQSMVEEHEEAVYIEESTPIVESENVNGYRISSSDCSLTDDASSLNVFALKSYAVTAGTKIRIVNTSNAQSSASRVYAFYSNESLTDGNNNILPTASTCVAINSRYNHNWNAAVFDDTLFVPSGAKLLVVTQVTSLSSNPAVYTISKRKVNDVVEDYMEQQAESSPYKTQVTRVGENIYVAYNKGNGTEIIYWFGRVYTGTNNTLGLRSVGYRSVNRTKPVASWDAATTSLCNQTSSDMIGPVAIDNTWVGGAHDVSGTATAVNTSWLVTADGEDVSQGATVNCVNVVVTAVNTVSHPTWGNLYEETIVMSVHEDCIDVEVLHNYKYSGAIGKTINVYYGMQSNGFGAYNSTLVEMVGGAHPTWTIQSAITSFTKGDYPYYSELVMRKPDGWKQMLRLDTTAYGTTSGVSYIGDHSWLTNSKNVNNGYSSIRSSKMYHVLISGTTITEGMQYRWKGTYRWWK